MKVTRFVTSAIALSAFASTASATTYSAAADFSAASNPNGVWSFGTTPVFGGVYSAFTGGGNIGGVLDYWAAATGPTLPGAFHNPTGSTFVYASSSVHDAGGLVLHPGPAGEYAVARFTAPITGVYTFSATFTGRDTSGTSTDVHIMLNSFPIYNAGLFGYGTGVSSGLMTMNLNAGDTLDATVGFGGFSYFNDSTRVDFVIEVPTPGAATILGLGLCCARGRRR